MDFSGPIPIIDNQAKPIADMYNRYLFAVKMKILVSEFTETHLGLE